MNEIKEVARLRRQWWMRLPYWYLAKHGISEFNVDAEKVRQIKTMFKLAARGMSCPKIVTELGWVDDPQSRHLSKFVATLIKNELVLGFTYRGIVCKQIITPEMFERANEGLKANLRNANSGGS